MRYKIDVFPYKKKNDKIVEWNSVISRIDDDGNKVFLKLTKPVSSKELSFMNAENIIRKI